MIGVLQSRAINCTEGTVKEGKVGELPSLQKKKKKKLHRAVFEEQQ